MSTVGPIRLDIPNHELELPATANRATAPPIFPLPMIPTADIVVLFYASLLRSKERVHALSMVS